MVLLSFSVKKDELLNGTKVRTTRLYTPEKWRLWQATIPPNNTKLLDLWWRSRRPDGHLIDRRPGADLYLVMFQELDYGYWPWRIRDSGQFSPMSFEEFERYLKEEGFSGEAEQFLRFFEDRYSPLKDKVFQSIAFPPKRSEV
jgi:hypothetical protein